MPEVPESSLQSKIEQIECEAGQNLCAGGQSKRVNVALALVSNRRVLFLDEPTSGLDSFTANEVILLASVLLPFTLNKAYMLDKGMLWNLQLP